VLLDASPVRAHQDASGEAEKEDPKQRSGVILRKRKSRMDKIAYAKRDALHGLASGAQRYSVSSPGMPSIATLREIEIRKRSGLSFVMRDGSLRPGPKKRLSEFCSAVLR
jgi:hypothetical protein